MPILILHTLEQRIPLLFLKDLSYEQDKYYYAVPPKNFCFIPRLLFKSQKHCFIDLQNASLENISEISESFLGVLSNSVFLNGTPLFYINFELLVQFQLEFIYYILELNLFVLEIFNSFHFSTPPLTLNLLSMKLL